MKKILFSIATICSLVACSGNKQAAEDRFDQATSYYNKGDYNLAKREIDSIKTNYPKEFDVLRKSIRLMRQIEMKEQERNFQYCDSMLTVLTDKSTDLKKNFKFIQDKEYDQIGRYVHKTLDIEQNVNHNYLRAEVFENGTLQLISVYNGPRPLKHNMVKVSLKDGAFAETQAIPFDGGRNFRFKDGDTNHERVTYNLQNDGGVTNFVSQYKDQPITLLFIGEQKEATHLLPAQKNAINMSMELSNTLQAMQTLVEEKRLAEAKINLLKRKEAEIEKQ
ncbi:MAG: hypothetical protein ACRCX4_06090 [Bacteroidales bacterium]